MLKASGNDVSVTSSYKYIYIERERQTDRGKDLKNFKDKSFLDFKEKMILFLCFNDISTCAGYLIPKSSMQNNSSSTI